MGKVTKIAVIGLGERGQCLLKDAILPACQEYGMEVGAILDLCEDRMQAGSQFVESATGKRPHICKNKEDILNDPQIAAVIISTSWEQHIHLAVEVMKHGKYAGIEVGGSYALEDCWKLVRTAEETGMHCMLLENCCYGKRELMILNMARQGVFGSIVHCEGGYHHDLRAEITGGKENRHYRLRNYINRNCENYPTHELGPIGKLLDINNGNRLVSLVSMASCSKGLHEYILSTKGEQDPLAKVHFAQGDVVTTVIRCEKGQTITITLDTCLPRGYSRGLTISGTKAHYSEDTDTLFLDGVDNALAETPHELLLNAKKYEEQYQHPLWQNYDLKGGHGGMDYLVISAFLEAVQKHTKPPIDTYDTATYMSISVLSEDSILRGSMPVIIPDFTRGKWYMREDIDFSLRYNLERRNTLRNLYY